MADVKFTPGDWYVSGVRTRLGGYDWHKIDVAPSDGSGVINIALVGFVTKTGDGRSDAHLIAASPDLYEALKDLLRNADIHNQDRPYQRVYGTEAARAALAKAEGKS